MVVFSKLISEFSNPVNQSAEYADFTGIIANIICTLK